MFDGGFHFEQPLWFLGLLALLPVAYWLKRSAARAAQGPLHRYADPHLLPHLAGTRDLRTTERWGRFLSWSLLWALLLTAMAGPRWDATDVRLFHPGNNLLILLDISRSMQVTDVTPNRLGRARHEISDLIRKNRGARLGLIVFASVPHVISPITEDTQTILNALPALSSELANPNLQGSRVGAALARAELLLAGLPEDSARSILLISDGDFEEPDLPEQFAGLASRGIRLHTLGIGTAEGGLVPGPAGGVIRDLSGEPVRSSLDAALLARLAEAGAGVHRIADYRDSDSDAILRAVSVLSHPPPSSDERTRVWNERYWIPVVLLMLLLLTRFRAPDSAENLLMSTPSILRSGVLCSSIAVLLMLAFCLPRPAVAGWFETSEQEALETYRAGDFDTAAESFSDPYRKGVALYRADRFDEAERAFTQAEQGKESQSARYNLGNTRFKRGDYTGAASAYESVLREDPSHTDAAHNLAVTRAALARLEQEQFRDEPKQEEGGDPTQSAEERDPESQEERQQEQQSPQQKSEEAQKSEDKQTSDEGEQSEDQQQGEQQQQSEQQKGAEQQQESEGEESGDEQGEDSGSQDQSSEGSGQQSESQTEGEGDEAGQGQGSDTSESAAGQAQGESSDARGADDTDKTGSAPDSATDSDTGESDQTESDSDRGDAGDRITPKGASREETASEPKSGKDGEPGDVSESGGEDEPESKPSTEPSSTPQEDEPADGEEDATQAPRDESSGASSSEDNPTDRRDPGRGEPETPDQAGEEPDSADQGRSDAPGSEPRQPEREDGGTDATTGRKPRSGPPGPAEVEPPETLGAEAQPEAAERFDQLGDRPGDRLGEDGTDERGAIDGAPALGAGVAVMEQRLKQVEGDPSLLIRNQYRLEELRWMQATGAPILENRPW